LKSSILHKTVVINAVGLTPALIGESTPRLRDFMSRGAMAHVGHVLPAVTTSVQSTYLTGTWPGEHGIVGNGWYFRDECEIKFWRQSNKLVERPKIWERAKAIDPLFTCANVCWWYAMYSSADYTVTPRPMYPADGRKVPDCWTHPGELRDWLQGELGTFPLFQFWGPATSINATRWIADAAIKIDERFNPTLSLVYLPHLDYGLQRTSTEPAGIAQDLHDLDAVCGKLIDHFGSRGTRIVVLSEYGVMPVSRPVHLNRLLRQRGLLSIRRELGRDVLDAGASAAFAVADHQIAHVYVNDRSRLNEVRGIVESAPGVEMVLDEAGKREAHLDHPRSGELVAVAAADSWFTYYYWLDDACAPDFARTVDIHRKPGYDPVELFLDPAIRFPKAKIGWILARRKLGMRPLMEVIPLDATLVRGSHGRAPLLPEHGPLFITSERDSLSATNLAATDVSNLLMRHLTDRNPGSL
jgi:predicted AlkP superfamily pyrophosphatase or phosphodiesterase